MAAAQRRGTASLLAILIAATALGPLSLNIFIPSIPGLQTTFAADYGTVQLVLTLYLVGLAGAQLVHGPLSDRFGRRPVMLGGLALHLVGSAACLAAPSIGWLIAGRIVQAIGGCVGMVLGRAIVRDLFDRERTASILAYITMAMMVAPMLSPTIGGFLDVWFGWRSSFAFVLGLGALLAAATWKWLPETLAQPAEGGSFHTILPDFGRLLRQRIFCGYSLQIASTALTFMAFLGSAPYVTVRLLDRPPSDYGLYFIPIAGAYIVANFAAARISPRVGIDRMITLGVLITVAGSVAGVALHLAGQLSMWTVFGPMTLIAFGHGFCLPTGFAGAVSVDPRLAGAAAGLSGFLQMATGAAASFVVGSLMTTSAAPMVAAVLIGTLCATAAHVGGVLMAKRPDDPPAA
ncbi:multidrug effflux MFS transporter [Shumkonia mesophila]|uniref:multidrug effflux MFS transporter n=1 Tax=Shumkonia mesophila TaxID=2838854 RepID=UPI002934D4B8|nr:multidrug effflux MFS transporter [Shumkonia mesophila]